MASIREQIMTAVEEHVTTYSRPAGVPLPVRTRVESPGASQLPVISFYQVFETPAAMHPGGSGRSSRGPVVRRTLDVRFEVLVKAVAGASTAPDADADPFLIWIADAMSAIGRVVTASYPRGICSEEEPDEVGLIFEYERASYSFVRAGLTFRFYYQTKRGDVEALT